MEVVAVFIVGAIIILIKIIAFIPHEKSRNGYVMKKGWGNHRYFKYEHRMIAESYLGRRLSRNEIVHHMNGRRDDNRPDNLCVIDSDGHNRYHAWYKWIRKQYNCFPQKQKQVRKLKEFGAYFLV